LSILFISIWHLSGQSRFADLSLVRQNISHLPPLFTSIVISNNHWIWSISLSNSQPCRSKRLNLLNAPPHAYSLFTASRCVTCTCCHPLTGVTSRLLNKTCWTSLLVFVMIVGSSFPVRLKVKSEIFYLFPIGYFFFVGLLQRKCLLDLSPSLELLLLLLND